MSDDFKPFVPANANVPELTPVPILMGVVLGIIFGASSLYLALKVGLTVSASIPIAVLSITLFRGISKVFGLRQATILENNIVQTAGSAGESIAFGVAVTMPALLILGFEMELGRIMLVAVLGGLLGILMMIPLRYGLIVKEHKSLVFPEGTACAHVLIAGETGGTSARTVFGGFFFGLIYKILNLGFKFWAEAPTKAITWFKGATVASEVSPELLGVGYIIGPRIACTMVGGGILSSWVLIPMITLFGSGLTENLFPGTKLISQMKPHEIWRNYVLYIGAGAVATAGIISLFRSLPTIIRSAQGGLKTLSTSIGHGVTNRTEVDLPIVYVLGGMLGLIALITLSPSLHMNLLGAVLIIAFGFLFVTVSSRLTGEIGSSSNPISGMTVATLLLTSLIFLSLGWVSPMYRVTALSVAAIVCVAASNGGTTAQDLKTGYLVGATPKNQQIAILIGALTSALVIGFTLNALNDAKTIYSKKAVPAGARVVDASHLTERQNVHGPEGEVDKNEYRVLRISEATTTNLSVQLQPGKYLVDDAGAVVYVVDPGVNGVLSARDDGTPVQKFEAPKARLMSLIIDGILTQKLPWGLVLLGAGIAIVLELCAIPSLAFAVGVYLPLAVSAPIFFGGAVRWMTGFGRRRRNMGTESDEAGSGVLFSSGLIAGASIAGIGLAMLSLKPTWLHAMEIASGIPWLHESELIAVVAFVIMGAVLFNVSLKRSGVRGE